MALWKPFRGNRADLDLVEKHDGYVYWCTDDNSLHFDYADADGTLYRKQINAKEASKLTGYDVSTALNSSNSELPTSLAVLNKINSTVDKISTISLPASGWTTATNVYSQVVTVTGATVNSRVDLYPTPEQLIELQSEGIALVAVNEDGIVTVYALNNKPTSDYAMQVTLTEVNEGV